MKKTPYKSIYTVLQTNKLLVIAAFSVALISVIGSMLFVFLMHKKTLNSAYAINLDGSILPIELMDIKDNFDIEVLHHLDMFHSYMYTLNSTNYERQIEKALWLGNETVDAIYKQKKAEGTYNKIIQFNLQQKVIEVKSQIDTRQEPFQFQTTVLFTVTRNTTTDTYKLVTKGNIVKIERNYPHNPHGLLIKNFYEQQLNLIKDES